MLATCGPSRLLKLRPSWSLAGQSDSVIQVPFRYGLLAGDIESRLANRVQLTTDGRFTRLTNAFSKKMENHIHSLALFHMHYNFCRVHQTLRVTPAIEAGISQHVWSIHEIIALHCAAT